MSTWHVDAPVLERYVSGTLAASAAASVEAHVLGCPGCRAALAPTVDADRLAGVWDSVVDRLDAPRPAPAERVLLRLGVRDGTARLVASAPSLTSSWLAAVTAALVFSLIAADTGPRGVFLFLTLAPILPVAGVAAAYGREVDPTHDLALAAPYSTFRLLLLRAAAVLGSTLALAGLAALLLPVAPGIAAAWLLPSVALTGATLAASTRLDAAWAAAAIAVTWVGVVTLTYRGTGEPYAAFGAAGQLACAAVLAVSAAVLVTRSHGSTPDLRRLS